MAGHLSQAMVRRIPVVNSKKGNGVVRVEACSGNSVCLTDSSKIKTQIAKTLRIIDKIAAYALAELCFMKNKYIIGFLSELRW